MSRCRPRSRLVAAWPALESIDFARGAVRWPGRSWWAAAPASASVLGRATQLSSVTVSIPSASGDCEDIHLGLPPTVTTLAINAPNLFVHPALAQSLATKLGPCASQLVHLALTDLPAEAAYAPTGPRGAYDALVAQATALAALSIGPCGLSSLPGSLAGLAGLVELRLVAGYARPAAPVAHTEVHGLITASRSLRKVALSSSIWSGWSAADRAAIETAAALKSIRLQQI